MRPRRRVVVSLVVVAVPVVVVVPVVARRRPRAARATPAVAAIAGVAIASTDARPTTTATGRARVVIPRAGFRRAASSGMQSVISRLSD